MRAAGRLAVHDAARDSRFAAHPLVTDAPHVRVYVGARLSSPDGAPIGVLSALGAAPREISEAQLHALAALARAGDAQVELRLLRDARPLKSEALLSSAQRISGIGGWEWDMRSQQITWSERGPRGFDRPGAPGWARCSRSQRTALRRLADMLFLLPHVPPSPAQAPRPPAYHPAAGAQVGQ